MEVNEWNRLSKRKEFRRRYGTGTNESFEMEENRACLLSAVDMNKLKKKKKISLSKTACQLRKLYYQRNYCV